MIRISQAERNYILAGSYIALDKLIIATNAEIVRVSAIALDAITRMDKARDVLTDGYPRPDCNWGMLDASDLRRRLEEVL